MAVLRHREMNSFRTAAALVSSLVILTLKSWAGILSLFVHCTSWRCLQAMQWRAHNHNIDANERCERLSAKLQELPLQEYRTRETLTAMSVPELKVSCFSHSQTCLIEQVGTTEPIP
jgi:hypothetical protein